MRRHFSIGIDKKCAKRICPEVQRPITPIFTPQIVFRRVIRGQIRRKTCFSDFHGYNAKKKEEENIWSIYLFEGFSQSYYLALVSARIIQVTKVRESF